MNVGDPLVVRWFKQSTYIFRMVVGYSAPVLCAQLVTIEHYNKVAFRLYFGGPFEI